MTSQGNKQRTPRAKAGAPDLASVEATLHPDVDAVLWILAREAVRIAREKLQAYLDQGAPYGKTEKGFSRWLDEHRDVGSN
jgi:hypothetical protein